jgi:hypothetical protein
MIYTPLDRDQASIRLLSGFIEQDGNFSCQLTSFSDVKACPDFIAVSYTWGSPSATRQIRLNGYEFPIRDNLFALLSLFSKLKRSQR